MWNSSIWMSGSPFCRQAATIASSIIGGSNFAVLDTGIGGLRKNVAVSVLSTRLRAPRVRTR